MSKDVTKERYLKKKFCEIIIFIFPIKQEQGKGKEEEKMTPATST
jgi:hypothetical protein